MDRYGDFKVGRTIEAGRRMDSGFSAETLTAKKDLDKHSHQWLRITNAATQDVVLPDALTLPNGWKVVVNVPEASGASVNVKTFHGTTPVLLRNVIAGRAYEFTLVDNATATGTWHVDFLEEADSIPTERYVSTFNATGDWGTVSGGYYTIEVTEVTHGRGTNPVVMCRAKSGSDYIAVNPDRIMVLADGNVQIRVPQIPDLRFEGQLIMV